MRILREEEIQREGWNISGKAGLGEQMIDKETRRRAAKRRGVKRRGVKRSGEERSGE